MIDPRVDGTFLRCICPLDHPETSFSDFRSCFEDWFAILLDPDLKFVAVIVSVSPDTWLRQQNGAIVCGRFYFENSSQSDRQSKSWSTVQCKPLIAIFWITYSTPAERSILRPTTLSEYFGPHSIPLSLGALSGKLEGGLRPRQANSFKSPHRSTIGFQDPCSSIYPQRPGDTNRLEGGS